MNKLWLEIFTVYNHMRSFIKAFDSNNLENTIDYSDYLSEADLSVKGPLKYKLAERLESAGVALPNQVSSSEMKNNKGHGKNDNNVKNNNQQANLMSDKNNLKKILRIILYIIICIINIIG